MDVAVLLVGCSDAKTAETTATRLVEERLAACGNVTGPVASVCRWKEHAGSPPN